MCCSSPRKPAGSVSSRPSIQPATSPWSWLPAVITSSPPGPSASPRSRSTGAASSAMSRLGRSRSSTASPRITSRSAARTCLEQRGAQLGPAQQVRAAAGAEVEVGDDDRPHLTRVAADAAAGGDPGRRFLARARGPVRDDAARRPRRRRGQGRAPRRRRRHPRLGPAVARRGLDLLPDDQPQQALGRARPRRRGRPRPGAHARAARRRARGVLPSRADGGLGARRRRAARVAATRGWCRAR